MYLREALQGNCEPAFICARPWKLRARIHLREALVKIKHDVLESDLGYDAVRTGSVMFCSITLGSDPTRPCPYIMYTDNLH
jgi:hypothetical protein